MAGLDYIWLITTAHINLNTTHRFRQGYFNNPAYKQIFRILDINNKIKDATRVGINFKLIKGLLYYVIKNRT